MLVNPVAYIFKIETLQEHIFCFDTSRYIVFNQGFRIGCVLSPGLLRIFFAVVLAVALSCFLIIEALAQDFIRIAGTGEKTRDELSEVFGAMLCTDDVGVVS